MLARGVLSECVRSRELGTPGARHRLSHAGQKNTGLSTSLVHDCFHGARLQVQLFLKRENVIPR